MPRQKDTQAHHQDIVGKTFGNRSVSTDGHGTAPIRQAVEYETLRHRPDAWSNSIYSEASHESDTAWNKLVACTGLLLSPSQLDVD